MLWLGATGGGVIAFITQAILARKLGPDAFGAFSALLGTIALISPLAGFGLAGFWLRLFGTEGWDGIRWMRASAIYLTINCLSAAVVVAIWTQLEIHDGDSTRVLLILSFVIVGQVTVELASCRMQLESRYICLSLVQITPHIIRCFVVCMFVFFAPKHINFITAAIIYACASGLVFLIFAPTVWNMFRGRIKLAGHTKVHSQNLFSSQKPSLIAVAAQAWPFGLAGLFYLVYFQIDIVMLKYMIGNDQAGYYSAAHTVMAAVFLLPSVLYQKFLAPKIHRWANHDDYMFGKAFRLGLKYMALLGVIAMFAVMQIAPHAIVRIFGPEYMATAGLLSILAFAVPSRFLAATVGSVLNTNGFMRLKVGLMGGIAILNIAANSIMIPYWGALGAAWSTVLCEACLLLLYGIGARSVFYSRRNK